MILKVERPQIKPFKRFIGRQITATQFLLLKQGLHLWKVSGEKHFLIHHDDHEVNM